MFAVHIGHARRRPYFDAPLLLEKITNHRWAVKILRKIEFYTPMAGRSGRQSSMTARRSRD